jgi:hypothetical protein
MTNYAFNHLHLVTGIRYCLYVYLLSLNKSTNLYWFQTHYMFLLLQSDLLNLSTVLYG